MAGESVGDWREWFTLTVADLSDGATAAQLALGRGLAELETFRQVESLESGRLAELEGFRPMWPSSPTSEQVTDRSGRGAYVYLYWRFNEGPAPGGYAQRKTYIGADAGRVALARRMVRSRERYLRVNASVRVLRSVMVGVVSSMERLVAELDRAAAACDLGGGS